MKYCVVVIWLFVIDILLFQCFYPRAGIIRAVEYDYKDIIIEDMAGLVWVYCETEDWNCGDLGCYVDVQQLYSVDYL